MRSLLSFFDVTKPGEIIWAHAVNNKQNLQKVCQSPDVMMIEGDISYLPKTNEIIMAHPPRAEDSQTLSAWLEDQTIKPHEEKLLFNEWADTIVAARKGVKLDFKDMRAVEFCLKQLQKINKKYNTPIFLSADILKGPDSFSTPLFDGKEFITLCHELCPNAILSLGWATEYSKNGKYSKELLKEMITMATLCEGTVTITIRACFTQASHKELQWFLENTDYAITIWNNEIISDELMEWMQRNLHQHRVLYDIDTGPHLPIR